MKNIALIFSYDVSLNLWEKNGSISRELTPYLSLKKNKNNDYIFYTYDQNIKKKFNYKNNTFKIFSIYSKFKYFKNKYLRFIFSFIYPFFIKNQFRNIDLIKTNQMWGSWVGVILKFLTKKPLIVRCGYEYYRNLLISNESFMKKIFLKYLSKITYDYADKILVTSPSIKKFIIDKFNISNSKILVQRNWIDTKKFSPKSRTNNLAIYVGRLSSEKNLPDLIRIIDNTNIKLNIYGEGNCEKNLRKLIMSQKKKNIFLKGIIKNNNLPSVLGKHSIFFLISKYEGQPKSLLEAMASGLTVIGKNSTGINDIIRHKINGFLLDKNYSNFDKIIKIINENKLDIKKIRNNAREYILQNHSLKSYLDIESRIYRELLDD